MPKTEEWVDRSQRTVRTGKLHERLQLLGFTGDERTTRRAVERAKGAVAGRPPSYLPAVDRRARSLVSVRLGMGPKVPGQGAGSELGHRDRGPSSSSRARGPGGNLFGNGGNQYCNGACPSPRPRRYLTLNQRPLRHGT